MVCRPFNKPGASKVSFNVIKHYGDWVLRVFAV